MTSNKTLAELTDNSEAYENVRCYVSSNDNCGGIVSLGLLISGVSIRPDLLRIKAYCSWMAKTSQEYKDKRCF